MTTDWVVSRVVDPAGRATARRADAVRPLPMTPARKRLCLAYALLSLVALAGTWHQNLYYLRLGVDPITANLKFWRDAFATPAATSITVDILLLVVAVFAWAVIEARARSIRFVWVYLIGGMFFSISVTLPLFLIARERRMASNEPLDLRLGDWLALATSTAIALFGTLRSFG
jgi:hypothetical protein